MAWQQYNLHISTIPASVPNTHGRKHKSFLSLHVNHLNQTKLEYSLPTPMYCFYDPFDLSLNIGFRRKPNSYHAIEAQLHLTFHLGPRTNSLICSIVRGLDALYNCAHASGLTFWLLSKVHKHLKWLDYFISRGFAGIGYNL